MTKLVECPDCHGLGGWYERTGPSDWNSEPCSRCSGTGNVPLEALDHAEHSNWQRQWEAEMAEAESTRGLRYYMGFEETYQEWEQREDEAMADGVIMVRRLHLWPTMASATPRSTPPFTAVCGVTLRSCLTGKRETGPEPVPFASHWTTDTNKELCTECEVKWYDDGLGDERLRR